MGTDNLFHKRKAKGIRNLKRRRANRQHYSKVLVVCEGEKTEPHYFKGLKDHYGLNSAIIEICNSRGSDPYSIFTFAKQRYRDEKATGDPFDRVYCVFDKDNHKTYEKTLEAIRKVKPEKTFKAVNSVPCFQYWLLLHFYYTTRPYSPLPKNSACNQVLADLEKHLPCYTKGDMNIFLKLINKIDFAKKNARKSWKVATQADTDNPTTLVHNLVDYLQNIKNSATAD